jgi:hypothetical protein
MSERVWADASAFPSFVSAAEANQLRSERPIPAAEPHLTIGGQIEAETQRRLERMREGRIGHTEDRLRAMREKAPTDFVFSALRGKSRADFNRER